MAAEYRQGFILTRNWRDTEAGVELEYWLVGPGGEERLLVPAQRAVFFLPLEDLGAARPLLEPFRAEIRELALRDFRLRPVCGCYFASQRELRRARDRLLGEGIAPLEADVNPADRFLMERFVAGSLAYRRTPRLHCVGSDFKPRLKVVSLDIETAMSGLELYSIGLYARDGDSALRKVMMVGAGADAAYVESYPSERALLSAFLGWVGQWNPDVFIGWNVVNFDLWFLQRLADKLGMRLTLGRARRRAHWRELDEDGERRAVRMPGRVALDGIELLRAAAHRFESFALESVSRQLLGDGKSLRGGDRGQRIAELFQGDKNRLAEYNLRDCQLVWDIFASAGLLDFAVARSQMTGLAIDRLGGSVASFDHLYLPRLHRAGFVAPNASGERPGSPGGFVLDSRPGIFDHVLVLDFKSLYPSIIRSFRIDPLGLALGLAEEAREAVVPGYDGGVFAREGHLLPAIIRELWQRRDEARQRGDAALSHAVKIIMNSFYGVLGTPGCRFFDPRLVSSITRRGHQIIQQTRDQIEALGERVIYGDTDSVFVWLQGAASDAEARSRGRFLQATLNDWWARRMRDEYGLDSALELEFETHFQRFLMPTVRGGEAGSKKRYAGVAERAGEREIIFKGLENVRTDWTALARRFQMELYRRVFFEEPYRDYVLEVARALREGRLDGELVYRKRLRRQLADYRRNAPPHVQAARLAVERGLPEPRRRDWIEYVVTLAGAEPLGAASAPLDYDHYAERQLAPVADGILHFLGTSYRDIAEAQLPLFQESAP